MILALRQTRLAGQKKFVGFDTSPFLLQALDKGEVLGLVAQNPTRMGYLGVVTAVKHLRGEKVDTVIDTGCVLVTKENQNEPAVKAVLAK
jgi:ribose transport system substrate-binding protein